MCSLYRSSVLFWSASGRVVSLCLKELSSNCIQKDCIFYKKDRQVVKLFHHLRILPETKSFLRMINSHIQSPLHVYVYISTYIVHTYVRICNCIWIKDLN